MSRSQIRHVAVLVEVDDNWGRWCVQGIADYAAIHGPWSLLIDPRDRDARIRLPTGWSGDGIIARLSNAPMAAHVLHAGVPAVDTDNITPPGAGIGRVVTDDHERARLALEHLLDRGYQRFAWFAPPSRRYGARRGEPFLQAVATSGFECVRYRPPQRTGRSPGWAEQQRMVARWLETLERPTGIFTADAHCGRQLLEICESLNVSVPGEVAVLAGDTDELTCNISNPPLSSVLLGARRLGYEAAALLDRLMQGGEVPSHPTLIKPLGVISRKSTDFLAIDNEVVATAIRFIRTHAHQGIKVSDLLRQVGISRRSLEQQFQKHLGRSPGEEIQRVRLEKARDLLIRSKMLVKQVAAASGFRDASGLGVAFRRRYGLTPMAFRRESLAALEDVPTAPDHFAGSRQAPPSARPVGDKDDRPDG